MKPVYFYLPARIYFERGCLAARLPEAARCGSNILVVTGRSFARNSGLLDRVAGMLSGAGVTVRVFSEVDPEPSVENVEAGAAFCREQGCDCVLGLGGGSALDAAKGIALLARCPGSLRAYFGEVECPVPPLPVVAVATTCGTGSEVTRYAVIVDRSARTKKTVSNELLIPRLAILDADLLETLPAALVAATGMDGFAHALEGFLSRKATDFTDFFALQSMRTLWRSLPACREEASRRDALEETLYGSLLAGFVINHTGTILVHGMGYSLTIKYGTHHGTANALFLPHAVAYLAANGYAAEARVLDEQVWGSREQLAGLIRRLDLPASLRELGAEPGDLDELTELALLGCQRAARNMRITPDRKAVRAILEAAW